MNRDAYYDATLSQSDQKLLDEYEEALALIFNTERGPRGPWIATDEWVIMIGLAAIDILLANAQSTLPQDRKDFIALTRLCDLSIEVRAAVKKHTADDYGYVGDQLYIERAKRLALEVKVKNLAVAAGRDLLANLRAADRELG